MDSDTSMDDSKTKPHAAVPLCPTIIVCYNLIEAYRGRVGKIVFFNIHILIIALIY